MQSVAQIAKSLLMSPTVVPEMEWMLRADRRVRELLVP